MNAVYDRPFQVWAYTVGHGQLLLRSPKSELLTTRIDLAFKDVGAIKLPTYFSSLSVIEIDPRTLGVSQEVVLHRKAWRLGVPGFEGFVIAGAAFVHEDDGEYSDPSPIYTLPP
jgi:hypothetical protein